MPHTAGAVPTSPSGRVPPLRLEAHRGDALARFVGGLDRDQHHAADALIQLLADVGSGGRRVGRDLGRLDDHRVRQVQVRRAGEHAGLRPAPWRTPRRPGTPVEVAFHAAVEHEVAQLVGRGLRASSAGDLARRVGRRGRRRARAGAAAGAPVARRIEAEDRLLLLEQRDDAVVPRLRRLRANERAERQGRRAVMTMKNLRTAKQ